MSDKVRIFASVPVKNHDREWIEQARKSCIDYAIYIRNLEPDKVIEVPFIDPWQLTGNHPVYCLGLNLQMMCQADIVVFHKEWWTSRACCIEHDICEQYDMDFINMKAVWKFDER